MSDADKDRKKADSYPDGDILAVLLRQHADIRDGLDRVTASRGAERAANFAAIKTFLKAHETAEQVVVRPVAEKTASEQEVAARLAEERKADEAIAELSKLDVGSSAFSSQFAEFVKAVGDHAEAEEDDEFPSIEAGCSETERLDLGRTFLVEFDAAGG